MCASPKKKKGRSAQDTHLNLLPIPILSMDREFTVISVNPAGAELIGLDVEKIIGRKCYEMLKTDHCRTDKCACAQAMENDAIFTEETIANPGMSGPVNVRYTGAPIKDEKGNITGVLEFILDVTKEKKQAELLISSMSTPVITVWDKVLLLPIVGSIDSKRAQDIMENMLLRIQQSEAKIIVLDIMGVPMVDSAVAQHLIKISRATSLMGCKCITTGVSPEIAQALVNLGLDLGHVRTSGVLKDGLEYAFGLLDLEVLEKK